MGKASFSHGYTKALATTKETCQAGLLQGANIWKNFLRLHEMKFEWMQTLDEKHVSMSTWDGCNSATYEEDPKKWQNLNSALIDYMREQYAGTKVQRIERVHGFIDGNRVTKICRASKRQMYDKQKHVLSIAAGCVVSAMSQNERHDLGTNIGHDLFQAVHAKVDNLAVAGLTDDRKQEMVKELVVEQAVAAGRAMQTADVAGSILAVLDRNPLLIAVDNKATDKFSDDANKRRKKAKVK